MNKCLGHELGLVPWLACNLINLFMLFYECRMAGYFSSVSGMGLLRVWGESVLSSDSIPEFLSSYQNFHVLFIASAHRLSNFYWKVIFHTVYKRFSLHWMSALFPPSEGTTSMCNLGWIFYVNINIASDLVKVNLPYVQTVS